MYVPKVGGLVRMTRECWARCPREYPADAIFRVLEVDVSDARWPCARIAHPNVGTFWCNLDNIKK